MDKERAKHGLPPLTDAEFFCEHARRKYEAKRRHLDSQFWKPSQGSGPAPREPLPELARSRGEGPAFGAGYVALLVGAILGIAMARYAASGSGQGQRAGGAEV